LDYGSLLRNRGGTGKNICPSRGKIDFILEEFYCFRAG
jgi:hypothetical protein